MYKLVALFKQPADVAEFDRHYDDTHAPLMQKVPELQKLLVARGLRSFGAESPYYLVAEMHFADREAFKRAMASDENREAGRDLMSFAADLVTMVHGEFS